MRILYGLVRMLHHLSLSFSLCFLTFRVLDWYNPQMAFTTNALSVRLMIAFCATVLLSSVGSLLLLGRAPERGDL